MGSRKPRRWRIRERASARVIGRNAFSGRIPRSGEGRAACRGGRENEPLELVLPCLSFLALANGYLTERIKRFGSRLISASSSEAPAINFVLFPPIPRYLFSPTLPAADSALAKYFRRISRSGAETEDSPRPLHPRPSIVSTPGLNERVRASVLTATSFICRQPTIRRVASPIPASLPFARCRDATAGSLDRGERRNFENPRIGRASTLSSGECTHPTIRARHARRFANTVHSYRRVLHLFRVPSFQAGTANSGGVPRTQTLGEIGSQRKG